MLHKYFCSICNALCPQYRFFQHCSFVSNCETCEMYISWLFLYTSATWEGYISLDIHIFTYFLSAHVSYRLWVKCYGMAYEVPSPMGRHFIDMVQKSFFAVCILLYLPKTFFNIMNFVGIASHIKCTFLSDYPIHFHVYMLVCLHFDIFTYFLSGNAWNRSWMKRYGMTDQPLIFDSRLQWHFCQVDTTLRIWHSMKLTFMSNVWVRLRFWEYFTKFGCTISYSSYIYDCFTKNVIYVT